MHVPKVPRGGTELESHKEEKGQLSLWLHEESWIRHVVLRLHLSGVFPLSGSQPGQIV